MTAPATAPLPDAPDVFHYLDYRAYLRDYYRFKKAESRGFSYRAFSRRAQLKSPNYLKLVIDGDRNLTPAMAERFGEACRLIGDALAFFLDLVAFNQSKTSKERNLHYERLSRFRRYRKTHRLDLGHAEYYSNWYIPAVRELAARDDFRPDAAWVARTLWPSVTRAEAQRALDLLVELGLLAESADGRLVQTETLLSTGPETFGLHVGNFHRAMIDRAKAAIDVVPAPERDISSLTLCLDAEGVALLKERIQAFRRELLELSAQQTTPTQVVQLNLQLFPLTRDADDP